MAERDELVAQLDVIEDLTVEDDPEIVRLVGEGLLAGGQIDDREAGVGEPRVRVTVEAELVGPPVP
jgi:hypothetical protein